MIQIRIEAARLRRFVGDGATRQSRNLRDRTGRGFVPLVMFWPRCWHGPRAAGRLSHRVDLVAGFDERGDG